MKKLVESVFFMLNNHCMICIYYNMKCNLKIGNFHHVCAVFIVNRLDETFSLHRALFTYPQKRHRCVYQTRLYELIISHMVGQMPFSPKLTFFFFTVCCR